MNITKKLSLIAVMLSATLLAPVAMADDDYDDDDRHYRTSQAKTNYISRQKAGEIARSRVKKITSTHVKNIRVKKIDFDGDDNYGAVYEVELIVGRGVEYDVKINARTGKVIYVRRDR